MIYKIEYNEILHDEKMLNIYIVAFLLGIKMFVFKPS